MAGNPASPVLQVKEIGDLYSRGNFQSLAKYFQDNNQLLGFKFFEVSLTSATSNALFAHNLGYIPQDAIVTQCTGAGVVTLNYGAFDKTNISLSTTGACRVRLLVGTYWNFISTVNSDAKSAQTLNPLSNSFSNPMSKPGDMLYGGLSGVPTRIPFGTSGQVPVSSGGSVAFQTLTAPTVSIANTGSLSGGFSATGNYTPPTGVKWIRVTVVGGGAGGGGTASTAANSGAAGGGSGGATCIKWIANPLSTYAFTVGAGGSISGANGGASTFGSLTAGGGAGGVSAVQGTTTTVSGTPSIGGTATGGDLNIQGGMGEAGLIFGTTNALSGAGGASIFGPGGVSQTSTNVGAAGLNYGSGGSGAAQTNNGGVKAGGAGADGIIIVEEFYQ